MFLSFTAISFPPGSEASIAPTHFSTCSDVVPGKDTGITMAPGSPALGVTIRPLDPADFTDVKTCCNQLAPMIPDLEENLHGGKLTGLVACDQMGLAVGAIVGMLDVDASISGAPIPLPCIRLLFVEVNARYRGKGVGKILMENFIQQQKSKNIACMTATLFKNYPEGVAFLEQHGFRVEKNDRNKMVLKLNLWSDFGVIDVQDDDVS
ncbi:MAG: GNAT family N-acetyltransferase [Candidatus Lokiarchaeota archaeon]|nr:GNAT family N-acetyltransferase [Candidatus Lokiarchaeota archaeon]